MKPVSGLKLWFAELLEATPVSSEIRPYLLNVLTKSNFDGLEKDRSIVLATAEANRFSDLQNIGDFAVWMSSFKQGYINQLVVESCGRQAYHQCYLQLGKRVAVYEMMADELPVVAREIHVRLNDELTTHVFIDA